METQSYRDKKSKSKLILILLLFSPAAHPLSEGDTLGTYYSSEVTYLDLAEYVSLNNFGPYFIALRKNQHTFKFSKFSKAKEICFNKKDLREFVPKNLPVEKAIDYLPTTENSGVLPDSVYIPDPETLCYKLKKGSTELIDRDFDEALKKSTKLFGNFSGLESIPDQNQTELKKIWNNSKSDSLRIKRLAKYWQKKIPYKPDALDILWKYIKENPDKNLLQAMFKYNIGDCGPKNFALGLSIWELSGETIPVRLNYAIWLKPEDKNYTPLTSDRIHIHVEYLIKNRKGTYEWQTAESSYSTEAYNNIYSEFTIRK